MAHFHEGIDGEKRRELGGGANGSDAGQTNVIGAWGNVMRARRWRRMEPRVCPIFCSTSPELSIASRQLTVGLSNSAETIEDGRDIYQV
ncbi:unnamed protein product [Calypogeia fissa]